MIPTADHRPGRAEYRSDTLPPSLSVVIPVFNGASTLPLQLEALTQQVGPPPFEVVIVDNRSTDGLERAIAPFREGDLVLRVVEAHELQGSSYARNVGIAASRAERIMFCDADDVVSRYWVAWGMAAFAAADFWTGGVTHLPPAVFAQGLEAVRTRMGDVQVDSPPPGNDVRGPFPVLMGGNFGASRAALLEVGGFDQSFPHAGDDNDLGFRAVRAGIRIVEMPHVRVASRGKDDPRALRRIAFRSAKAHAQLANRYGMWTSSRAANWLTEPLRCVGAAVKMATHPRGADWGGLRTRSVIAAGTFAGGVEFHLLGRSPAPKIGVGLTSGPDPSAGEGRVYAPVEGGDAEVVSVIIPAYNAADYIVEQLESLAAQVEAPRFEVVVADNGSTDETASLARSAGKRLALDVSVVDARGVASASYARNVGARAARGEVLLFCDADDFVGEEWVRELAAAVRSRDDALTVGTLRHGRFNDEATLEAYDIPPEDASAPLATGYYPIVTGGFAGYLPTVAGNDFGVRRSLYLSLGGMDPSFPGGSEETDFSWRAQQAGAVVVHAPRAVVHYRLRQTPEAVFRQQRIQQVGRMLLWMRHRDAGMSGPSWKSSAVQAARHLPAYAVSRRRDQRLRHARIAGGHVGAMQGMLRYRVLRRVPPRDLMTTVPATSE